MSDAAAPAVGDADLYGEATAAIRQRRTATGMNPPSMTAHKRAEVTAARVRGGRISAKAAAERLWCAGHTVVGEADPDRGVVSMSDRDPAQHRRVEARVDAKG